MLFADLDDDAVDVCLGVSPDLSAESLVHELLESCACILEAEGHAHVEEHTAWCNECRLLFILLHHLDLMVTRKGVQKTQVITPGGESTIWSMLGPWDRPCLGP